MNMYPMSFDEFLMAFNQEILIDEIKKCFNNNETMIEPLHHKLIE